MRHTTFRFALDPSPAQAAVFARHAGASRFAYNQCLEFVTVALKAKATNPSVVVPWSGFDLINTFNAWKRSEAAGRILIAAQDGNITKEITGLAWRHEVSAQVFEEAAIDLGRALVAYEQSRIGKRKGRGVGFPKRNTRAVVATAFGSETSKARLDYKAAWFGADLVICDRWFPSTQDLLALRMGQTSDGIGRAELFLRWLRAGDGQRLQRRGKPCRLG